MAGAAAVVVALTGTALAVAGTGPSGSPDIAAGTTPTPATSPADEPTARTDPPTGRPSMLPVGTTGFDATPGGSLWRVSATTCGDWACAEIIRSAGDGLGAETVGLIEFDDEAEADLYELPPVELVRVGEDERDLWAFGQQLWSSHDGGATWDRQKLSGDNRLGRVLVEPVGDDVYALQDGGPVRLWRSPASTDDWTVVPLPGGVEYADHLTSIGDTLVVTAYLDDRRVLLLNDGGDTWRQGQAPCQGEAGPVRTSGTILTMPCPAEGITFDRGAQVIVWRSPDGETWTPFAGVRHSSYLDDVFPVDDTTVFAVTGDGGLLVTADGQEQVDLPTGKDDSSLFGRFVTPERGYLLTSPQQLLGTEDGGHTWTRLD
jgi:photosystem II stability/assembly factor-like uncharacterized protein